MAMNRTTTEQDESFTKEWIAWNGNIDAAFAISWVTDNLDPSDVYSEDDLKDWACERAPTDIFDEDVLLDWIRTHFDPDDVFSSDELEKWAEGAGLY